MIQLHDNKAWATIKRFQSVLGLLILFVAAILLSPQDRQDGYNIFLSTGNLTDILRQVSEIGIVALAMTFVILTAGIDLSVGSLLALGATVVAMALTQWQPTDNAALHIALAIGAAIGACTLAGLVNGAVIARMRVQPFIVTLAAMIGIRGLAKWMTDNTNIDIGFGEDVGAVFANLVAQKEVVIGTFLVLTVVSAVLLSKTIFGRYVRAIGDNEKASDYAGLPRRWITVAVYGLCGLMTGIAGVIHCAQNNQGSANDGVAFELDVIAAVVIGGTSLAGGKGTIFGTFVGTLIIGVLTNILGLIGMDENEKMMVKAVIIIIAVRMQMTRKVT